MNAETAAVAAEIERILAEDPHNVRALIRRADLYTASGDRRAATSFYVAAVRAAPPTGQVPADLVAELRRARSLCEQNAEEYKTYLRQRLVADGFNEDTSSRRFGESIEIVLGQRTIQLQQPRKYYFPRLASIPFFDPEQFAWVKAVEAATPSIRTELLEVLRTPDDFAPYVHRHPNRPRKYQMGMVDNPAWSAFYLWKNGEIVPGNAERCPATMRAMKEVPLATMPDRSPSVLFSLLRPGAHIPPHNGLVNTRLICHLPLIVPGRCVFRVGNEVREWKEGEVWLFDDTIEHEAWNTTSEMRVILIFEVWRPELTEEERGFVTSLFRAIDAYAGTKPEWEI
jgi:aspartyl/asparaginyl beta-hydroxylase (cupin superfamily)